MGCDSMDLRGDGFDISLKLDNNVRIVHYIQPRPVNNCDVHDKCAYC